MLARPPLEGPITVKRLERAMNVLCRIMRQVSDEDALTLVPLYDYLTVEIEKCRAVEAALAAARSRPRQPA